MSNEWRAIIAALANPDAQRLYAEVVLGVADASTLSEKKRQRAIGTLTSAGLIQVTDRGRLEITSDRLDQLLADAAEPRKEGIDRFLEHGRIQSYPTKPALRREMLEWVAETALTETDVVTEPELGERLEKFHADVATLRRYLVDEGLLLRTPSGTSYSRTSPR
jgi:hypothetical protein